MIGDKDRQTIAETAAKYHVRRVVLFGSSLSSDGKSRDIDIGVEGVEDKDFFAFYGEFMCALSKPVDVVDLSTKSRLVDLIQQECVPLVPDCHVRSKPQRMHTLEVHQKESSAIG